MTSNRKVTGTAAAIPAGLTLGAVASIAVTLLLSGVSAWLILNGRLPEQAVGYCAMVILLLSSAAGAAVAAARVKRLRFQICMAAGAIYYVLLVTMTAMFFGGIYDGMGVTALMVLCGCGLVILLGFGGGNRAGCRKRKMGH